MAVPSALAGLTSLFGMERGGPRRHSRLKIPPNPPKGGCRWAGGWEPDGGGDQKGDCPSCWDGQPNGWAVSQVCRRDGFGRLGQLEVFWSAHSGKSIVQGVVEGIDGALGSEGKEARRRLLALLDAEVLRVAVVHESRGGWPGSSCGGPPRCD